MGGFQCQSVSVSKQCHVRCSRIQCRSVPGETIGNVPRSATERSAGGCAVTSCGAPASLPAPPCPKRSAIPSPGAVNASPPPQPRAQPPPQPAQPLQPPPPQPWPRPQPPIGDPEHAAIGRLYQLEAGGGVPSARHSGLFHAAGDKKPAVVACEAFLARFRAASC